MPLPKIQWIWSDDARYREVLDGIAKSPTRKEAALEVEPGGGPMSIVASSRFLDEVLSVVDDDIELGVVILGELRQMIYRFYDLDFDTSVIVMPAKLYRGDPVHVIAVVFAFEYGRFFCLMPEEIGLDEKYLVDALLLRTELGHRCDAEE